MPRRKQVSPACMWCATLNNWTPQEHGVLEFRLNELKKVYPEFVWVIGREIGESGTPHLQMCFKRDKKWRPLPALKIGSVNRIHFERCKGNWYQNVSYCTKDGDYDANFDAEEFLDMNMPIEELVEKCDNMAPNDDWPSDGEELDATRDVEHQRWAAHYERLARRLVSKHDDHSA